MRKLIARRLLARFSRRYDYDVGYLESMLDVAPAAFFKFSRLMGVAGHRQATPREAYFAAKLVAALAEDCGPCTQLVVNMGREAGVGAADQLEAVLTGASERMSEETTIGYEFARALCQRSASLDDARERVRRRFGEEGVIELSLCVAVGRVFPLTKAGMGFGHACRRVTVGARPVDVVRHAV